MMDSSQMTSSQTDFLFQPFTLKGLTLPNRIVMAPMTRGMSPSGVPSSSNADYYRRRAEAQVGLIISEGTVVNRPASRNQVGIPFFHGEQALNGWKHVIDQVHQGGGLMGPQIWHTGASYGPERSFEPEGAIDSPSGLYAPGKKMRGEPMKEVDILDTIQAFTQAAVDAERLGFDVVELHGAHGYLIDQFFWHGTNQRTDDWGGDSLEQRSRFALEIVREIRKVVKPELPLILRISQWKSADYSARLASTPNELEAWLAPFVDAGVDVFHCSQRRFWEPEFPEVDGDEGMNFAGWTKKLTGKPTISVGSVGLDVDFISTFQGASSRGQGLDALKSRMERDEFDLIAVGRALLTDPHWVQKVQKGAHDEFKGFTPKDLQTLY